VFFVLEVIVKVVVIIKNYTPEMIDKKRQKQEKEKTNNLINT
jgi:hypothetical protein